MERDERRSAAPRDLAACDLAADEAKRNEALARYDAHPGIAVLVLAVMAFLFIVITYQLASAHAGL